MDVHVLQKLKESATVSGDGSLYIEADLERIFSLDHHCDGCVTGGRCCCASYNIHISREEMECLLGFLPELAGYCPHLEDGDGYVNVFDEAENGLYAVDTDESGLCAFAYRENRGTWCAVHSAALDNGFDLDEIKPLPCLLWPVTLVETSPLLLTVESDVFSYHCNRESPDPLNNRSMKRHLASLLGKENARALWEARRQGKSRERIYF